MKNIRITLIIAAMVAMSLIATSCNKTKEILPEPVPESPPEQSEELPSLPEDSGEIIDPLEEAARVSAELNTDEQQDLESVEAQDRNSPSPKDAEPVIPAGNILDSGEIKAEQIAATASYSEEDIQQILLQLINEERSANGLDSLGLHDTMQFAARIRAEESLDKLSHTRTNGSAYYTAFDEAGFDYAGKWHGENLAVINFHSMSPDSDEIARNLFDEWRKSSGHHQNMLSENFVQTGLGVFIEQDGNSIHIGAAQLFAGI